MKKPFRGKQRLIKTAVCLGAAVGGVAALHAQTGPATTDDKITKLEKEKHSLRQRLDAWEAMAQKEGLLPSGQSADKSVSAMSDVSLSGFISTSYFHDSSEPSASIGHVSPGYLWNRVNDSFSINKVKLTFASPPVERSGDKFDAAFRVSLIAGQDAPIVNTKAGTLGFDYLREAYIEFNVPIGTGLNVRAGELISLLNYESGDGGAAN